jgi:hypothetical protein
VVLNASSPVTRPPIQISASDNFWGRGAPVVSMAVPPVRPAPDIDVNGNLVLITPVTYLTTDPNP